MITLFTPSFADEDNVNAQNLTTKEIVARLSPDIFRVIMLCCGAPDERIAVRENTVLLPCRRRFNAALWLIRGLSYHPDIYFFPREGALDTGVFISRKVSRFPKAVVSYAVSGGLGGTLSGARHRNICESDRVVANSHYIAEILRQRFDVEADTVYDGNDQRFFYPRKPDDVPVGSLTVLYAGSFRSYKRPELVVREAAKHPDVTFQLAGAGEEEEHCRALAQELRCKNVRFLGPLSQPQVGEAMRQADIFFFPSILEGHPQVLLQAAACGLPVVAMDSYRPEYVINKATGYLASSDDELSARLELLLTNPHLRKTMSQAAHVHSRKFDWDLIAQQWAQIFQQVATGQECWTAEQGRLEFS